MDNFVRIYKKVIEIPMGLVSTYGDVAMQLGNRYMARFVGNALHVNPYDGVVPCHRVVNASGHLAEHFGFGGIEEQAKRLEEDGVETENGFVDLKRYRFDWKYSRCPSVDEPLSSDVFIIHGKKNNYIIDAGSSDEAFEFVKAAENRVIIVTHFHKDHTANIKRLPPCRILGGRKTCDYIKTGETVTEKLLIEDGVHLEIKPFPTCHAKGSLAILLDNRYLFVGDGLCGCFFPDHSYGYNAGMLLETIRELERTDTAFVVSSHSGKAEQKDLVIDRLRKIYAHRNGNNPFIFSDIGFLATE